MDAEAHLPERGQSRVVSRGVVEEHGRGSSAWLGVRGCHQQRWRTCLVPEPRR